MADKSGIEWTDSTWNPVTGCTEVSPGCDHCYAKTFAERFRGVPGHHFEQGFDLVLRPERLDQPIRWKRPRRIFVNSMSDLFHQDVPDTFIAEVFTIMATARQHTFQVLTKRPGRMRSLLKAWAADGMVTDYGWRTLGRPSGLPARQTSPLWTPPANVWLGVSVENQRWADIRIPVLIDTPAASRFLSMEPLLGSVDLEVSSFIGGWWLDSIDWVIVGGESGRGARPMDLDWVRSIREQCAPSGNGRRGATPFFYKQQGSGDGGPKSRRDLDGRTWDEFPEPVIT